MGKSLDAWTEQAAPACWPAPARWWRLPPSTRRVAAPASRWWSATRNITGKRNCPTWSVMRRISPNASRAWAWRRNWCRTPTATRCGVPSTRCMRRPAVQISPPSTSRAMAPTGQTWPTSCRSTPISAIQRRW